MAAGAVIVAMLSLGAVEACYGLVQYLTGYPLIFGYTKTINLEMATGTYINYDHFAGLMEMLVPIALAGAFFSSPVFREIIETNSSNRELSRVARIFQS